jgi:hypothetical protein
MQLAEVAFAGLLFTNLWRQVFSDHLSIERALGFSCGMARSTPHK